MKDRRSESDRHIDAVLKALDILECFGFGTAELSLKQLSDMTGMYKSRVIRICGTLERRGYLIRDPKTGLYRLGPRLMVMGKAYERANPLSSLARPILRDLARTTQESASIFVVDGINRICLAREEGPQAIRYAIAEGQRLELYAGAGGKVLLAFGPEELRRRVLTEAVVKRLTPNTIVDLDRLKRELAVIRRQGYAYSFAERSPDACALAVPVYDHEGMVCAAISIAGPCYRFSKEALDEKLRSLMAAARELSSKLGDESQGKIYRSLPGKGARDGSQCRRE